MGHIAFCLLRYSRFYLIFQSGTKRTDNLSEFSTAVAQIKPSSFVMTDEKWHGLNRNRWHRHAEMRGTIQTEIATTVAVSGTSEYDSKTISVMGGVEPTSNLITRPLAEKDESVLSTIRDSRYVANDYINGMYTMTIGFDVDESNNVLIPIDNDITTTMQPVQTPRLYDITGPVNFNSYFSISPRDNVVDYYKGNDLATSTFIGKNTKPQIYTGYNHITVASNSIYSINVYNLSGQKVEELHSKQGQTIIPIVKGIYMINIASDGTSETAKVYVR